jgi:hypothetical protein
VIAEKRGGGIARGDVYADALRETGMRTWLGEMASGCREEEEEEEEEWGGGCTCAMLRERNTASLRRSVI